MGVKNFSEFSGDLSGSDFKQYFWDFVDDGFSIDKIVEERGSRILSKHGDVLDCYVIKITPPLGYKGDLDQDISKIEKIAQRIESSEGIQFVRYSKPYQITLQHVLFFKRKELDLSRFFKKNFQVSMIEDKSSNKIFFFKNKGMCRKATGILYYDLSTKTLVAQHSLIHSLNYSFLIEYSDCYDIIHNQMQRFLNIDPLHISSSHNDALSTWRKSIDELN